MFEYDDVTMHDGAEKIRNICLKGLSTILWLGKPLTKINVSEMH